MGYFANLYIIEAYEINKNEIKIITSIYEGDSGKIPYFSWIQSEKSNLCYSYANNTIYCNMRLNLLEGYPVSERQILGSMTEYSSILINAQFTPKKHKSPTVCHILLPEGYLPRRDLKPLLQPNTPFVNIINNRVILTWPIEGAFHIEFCIVPLSKDDVLNDYDRSKILRISDEFSRKFGVEFNLGIIKFKFGN